MHVETPSCLSCQNREFSVYLISGNDLLNREHIFHSNLIVLNWLSFLHFSSVGATESFPRVSCTSSNILKETTKGWGKVSVNLILAILLDTKN